MPKSTRRHVVPNPDGGWKVVKPGGKRASAKTATQAQAEKRAKEIVANQGGGEVRVHRPDGRVRDSDTVRPGNDPNPPKDKKH
jgi:sarcosine oxidase gamma subunit